MMVEIEFTCCEVEQTGEAPTTGSVENVEVTCSVCGHSEWVEVDTTDYN